MRLSSNSYSQLACPTKRSDGRKDKILATKGEPDLNKMSTPTVSGFIGAVIIRPVVVAINSLVLASLMSYVIAERLDWRPVSSLFVYSSLYGLLIEQYKRSPYALHATFLLSALTTLRTKKMSLAHAAQLLNNASPPCSFLPACFWSWMHRCLWSLYVKVHQKWLSSPQFLLPPLSCGRRRSTLGELVRSSRDSYPQSMVKKWGIVHRYLVLHSSSNEFLA